MLNLFTLPTGRALKFFGEVAGIPAISTVKDVRAALGSRQPIKGESVRLIQTDGRTFLRYTERGTLSGFGALHVAVHLETKDAERASVAISTDSPTHIARVTELL
jgi:hypothetical protein